MALINLSLPEEIPLIPDGYKIKSGGIFDLEELYTEMERWFEFGGYSWRETKYRVAEMPNGLSQIEIKWECEKKGSEYLTYYLSMHWQAFVTEVEVNVDGIKKKMNKGSIEFRFEGKLKRNVEAFSPKEDSPEAKKRFLLKGSFGKFIMAIYDKVIIKNQVDYYKGFFFGESQRLFDEIKAFLQLYS